MSEPKSKAYGFVSYVKDISERYHKDVVLPMYLAAIKVSLLNQGMTIQEVEAIIDGMNNG